MIDSTKRVSIAVLTIRDGREDVHERSLASLKEHAPEPDHHVIVDDSEHELGFAGAIAEGWEKVIATGADWCLHHEADFLFNARLPVDRMIALLKRQPHIVQVALKRQPCNPSERSAGGIVEENPDSFRQRVDRGDIFTEHRRFFTTNPSVYPAALCAQGWPQEPRSEGLFSFRLFEDPDAVSVFWGAKFDAPLCEHIGERTGAGY